MKYSMVMRYRKQLEDMARSWCSLTNQEPTEEILNAFISGGKLALENRDCIINEDTRDKDKGIIEWIQTSAPYDIDTMMELTPKEIEMLYLNQNEEDE